MYAAAAEEDQGCYNLLVSVHHPLVCYSTSSTTYTQAVLYFRLSFLTTPPPPSRRWCSSCRAAPAVAAPAQKAR